MSGNLLIFIELLLVFGLVFGWGFRELHQLKKHRQTETKQERQAENQD